MCYLFIWQWVLRIIMWKHWNSHVRYFVRMCEYEQFGLSCDKLWFKCACFMSVIQENEDLYLIAHTHKHTRQKLVIVYFFFAILLNLCCILYLLGKRTIINFSSVSACSWADEKNTSQTLFQDKESEWVREKNAFETFSEYLKRNKKGMFNNILTDGIFSDIFQNNWTQRFRRGGDFMWKNEWMPTGNSSKSSEI